MEIESKDISYARICAVASAMVDAAMDAPESEKDRLTMSAAALAAWHHLNAPLTCRHLGAKFVQPASQALIDTLAPLARTGKGLLYDFPQRTGDVCLDVFGLALRTWKMPIAGKVLEIGCAEADWIAHALKADPFLQITGVDWRERHSDERWTFVRGDVNALDFPENSFDWVISISAIEHIGLGHYDSDPVREDGDTECLQRIQRWLKPGGSLYFDVPYTPEGYAVQGTKQRTYDNAAVDSRLWSRGWLMQASNCVSSDALAWVGRWPALNPTTGRKHFYCANWWMKERE